MKLTSIKQILLGAVFASLLAAPATSNAQPSAHYPTGVEGLYAATLPPPGIYLRDYNYFYYSDQLNNNAGNKINGLNPKAFIYANIPRLLWITDLQVLGGYIGFDGLVPLESQSLKVGGFDDSTFGVCDPFLEATWSKHTKQFDFALGFGAWMPTENFNPQNPTWAGLGYWTYMFTAGATVYFDQDKKWSFSALNRYEISAQQDDTGINPGQVYTVEGGIGYRISNVVTLGAIGYYQAQTTSSTGDHVTRDRANVAAIGPEIAAFWPSAMLGVSLRYAYEFLAESRLQGQTVTLTITKRF